MENNNRLSQDEIDALLKGGDDTAQEQPESGHRLKHTGAGTHHLNGFFQSPKQSVL